MVKLWHVLHWAVCSNGTLKVLCNVLVSSECSGTLWQTHEMIQISSEAILYNRAQHAAYCRSLPTLLPLSPPSSPLPSSQNGVIQPYKQSITTFLAAMPACRADYTRPNPRARRANMMNRRTCCGRRHVNHRRLFLVLPFLPKPVRPVSARPPLSCRLE